MASTKWHSLWDKPGDESDEETGVVQDSWAKLEDQWQELSIRQHMGSWGGQLSLDANR